MPRSIVKRKYCDFAIEKPSITKWRNINRQNIHINQSYEEIIDTSVAVLRKFNSQSINELKQNKQVLLNAIEIFNQSITQNQIINNDKHIIVNYQGKNKITLINLISETKNEFKERFRQIFKNILGDVTKQYLIVENAIDHFTETTLSNINNGDDLKLVLLIDGYQIEIGKGIFTGIEDNSIEINNLTTNVYIECLDLLDIINMEQDNVLKVDRDQAKLKKLRTTNNILCSFTEDEQTFNQDQQETIIQNRSYIQSNIQSQQQQQRTPLLFLEDEPFYSLSEIEATYNKLKEENDELKTKSSNLETYLSKVVNYIEQNEKGLKKLKDGLKQFKSQRKDTITYKNNSIQPSTVLIEQIKQKETTKPFLELLNSFIDINKIETIKSIPRSLFKEIINFMYSNIDTVEEKDLFENRVRHNFSSYLSNKKRNKHSTENEDNENEDSNNEIN
jgi:hypothetical protein